MFVTISCHISGAIDPADGDVIRGVVSPDLKRRRLADIIERRVNESIIELIIAPYFIRLFLEVEVESGVTKMIYFTSLHFNT